METSSTDLVAAPSPDTALSTAELPSEIKPTDTSSFKHDESVIVPEHKNAEESVAKNSQITDETDKKDTAQEQPDKKEPESEVNSKMDSESTSAPPERDIENKIAESTEPCSKDDSGASAEVKAEDAAVEAKQAESADGETKAEESKEPAVLHLVLIDDDEVFRTSVKTHFEEKKWVVETFASKDEIKDKKFTDVSLFIVDQKIGEEDGRSLALDLREQNLINVCPMVLLIDEPMDRNTREFTIKLGFKRVFQKPVQLEALERALHDDTHHKSKTAEVPKPDAESNSAEKACDTELKDQPEEKKHAPTPVKIDAPVVVPKKRNTKVSAPGADPVSPEAGKVVFKGILVSITVGIIFAAAPLALLVSAGFGYSAVSLEGILLGLVAGVVLGLVWKKLPENPPPAVQTFGIGAVVTLVWGALLMLRLVLNKPFVERTEAMIKALEKFKDVPRQWGSSEYIAMAFIFSQVVIAFIVATIIVQQMLKRAPKQVQLSRLR